MRRFAPRAANQDLFTAVGTSVLAVCVVVALAHVHFWVLLALVVGLFGGPTLSILGGLESKDCCCLLFLFPSLKLMNYRAAWFGEFPPWSCRSEVSFRRFTPRTLLCDKPKAAIA